MRQTIVQPVLGRLDVEITTEYKICGQSEERTCSFSRNTEVAFGGWYSPAMVSIQEFKRHSTNISFRSLEWGR